MFSNIKHFLLTLITAWTVIIIFGVIWHAFEIYDSTIKILTIQASNAFEKDLIYRKWAAGHGGVYVPVTKKTQPNPYLSHIKNRDIKTGSGRELTLVNPAYMTRQIHEIGRIMYGHQGSITSLNPINPDNIPDQWEKKSLLKFEKGLKEAVEVSAIHGEKYLRLMRPMVTDKSCLKCHADQGYKINDIRGGISVSIPIDSMENINNRQVISLARDYILIWIIGLFGIVLSGFIIRRRVDEKKNAEEALKKNEEKYRVMMESMQDSVYICSENLQLEYLNPAMIERLGYDATGEFCYKAIYGYSAQCAWCVYDKIKQGEHSNYELFNPVDKRFYYIMNSPLLQDDGLVSKLTIAKDITEIKTMAAQLLQLDKMASVGQLAAGVAHEINNPVGFVSSNLQTLSDYHNDLNRVLSLYQELTNKLEQKKISFEQTNEMLLKISETEKNIDLEFIMEDINELINESREGVERIKIIVIALKDFAHPGDDKIKDVNINDGIESTLNVLRNELKYKITLRTELGDIPIIQGYPQQLNQVFMNIIVNAVHAVEDKAELMIKTGVVNDHVEIVIADTGPGIPEENLSKLFDPFFTTKEVGSGTGLGLNIAFNIIQKHNGTIQVDSKPGHGATFTIKIPLND